MPDNLSSKRDLSITRVILCLSLIGILVATVPMFVYARPLFGPPTTRRSAALDFIYSLRYYSLVESESESFKSSVNAPTPSITGTSDALLVINILDPVNLGAPFVNRSANWRWLARRQNTVTGYKQFGGFSEPGEDPTLKSTLEATRGIATGGTKNLERINVDDVITYIENYRENHSYAYRYILKDEEPTGTLLDSPSLGSTLMALQIYDAIDEMDSLPNKTQLIDWIMGTQNATTHLFEEIHGMEPATIYSVCEAILCLDLLDSLTLISGDNSTLVTWIMQHQVPSGGFSPTTSSDDGSHSDLYTTYLAVMALQSLNQLSNPEFNSSSTAEWIISLQQEDGGFVPHALSPSDGTSSTATRLAVESLNIIGQTSFLDELVPWETPGLTPVEIVLLIGISAAIITIVIIIKRIRQIDYP
ncbi:MAG: prenyltransferase/squalene oxidase repeat-containing protein [Candidatus Ranarchaeia archaeon]